MFAQKGTWYLPFLCFLIFARMAGASSCESLLSPFYKRANPTAQLTVRDYTAPNNRSLASYDRMLFNPMGTWAVDFVPENGVVVNSGSGLGLGLRELAWRKRLKSVTQINTQPVSQLVVSHPRVHYIEGWSEEEIPQLADNSVDVFIDLWGAFAYSPDKVFLIEVMYKKLKPGGRAVLLHPNGAWLTIVQTHKTWHLDKYLKDQLPPNIFQEFDSDGDHTVFLFSKPLHDPPELKLGLQVLKVRLTGRDYRPKAILTKR